MSRVDVERVVNNHKKECDMGSIYHMLTESDGKWHPYMTLHSKAHSGFAQDIRLEPGEWNLLYLHIQEFFHERSKHYAKLAEEAVGHREEIRP